MIIKSQLAAFRFFQCPKVKKIRGSRIWEMWTVIAEMQREKEEGRKEMFYLMTHSTHFIYSYMASDIL